MLGNDEPAASIAGEIIPSREFYDYEAKYLDEGSKTIIPADLTPAQLAEVQRLAIEAFKAIDGAGMSRVDFLLSRATGALLLNEINTIPGFTTISMFAKLWGASGVDFAALVDRLIQLAIARHEEKQRLEDERAVRRVPAAVLICGIALLLGHRPATPVDGPGGADPRAHRRHRRRARLRRGAQRRLRPGAGAARGDVRPGAAGGLPRHPGHGHLVGHPARSREHGARRPRSRVRSNAAVDEAERWTGARARTRRGLVLPGRGARRAQPVEGAAPRAPLGGARRQAHQGGARARARRSTRPATTPPSASALYRYYATIAPAYLRWLRWLLLLPGGNRAEGLAQMERTSRQGQLVRGEADYQLHLVYLWYEQRFSEALAIVIDLQRRYPRNPLFRHLEATITDVYFHDHARSLAASEALVAAAARGEVNRPAHRRRARAPQHRGAARSTADGAIARASRSTTLLAGAPAAPARRDRPRPRVEAARGRRADATESRRSSRQFVSRMHAHRA